MNHMQARECTDMEDCSNETGKPIEEQECYTGGTSMPVCENGVRICSEDESSVVECTGDAWTQIEACPYGCKDGECLDQDLGVVTGMFLNPGDMYIGFLISLMIIGSLMYVKLH